MKDPLVCFVVLVYNQEIAVLNKLFTSLASQRVIIIDHSDNAHLENNKVLVLAQKQNFTYVAPRFNGGYARGMNRGIELATQEKYKWIVLLNDDCQLSKTGVTQLVEQLQSAQPGVLGPEVGRFDWKRWTTIMNVESKDSRVKSKDDDKRRVDYVSGSCLIIHSDVITTIGKLNESYVMYYEDAEYGVRAKRAGFPVYHFAIDGYAHPERGVKRTPTPAYLYYLARNHLRFILLHAPFNVKLHEVVRLPKTLYEFWRHNDFTAMWGIFDALVGKMGKYTRE